MSSTITKPGRAETPNDLLPQFDMIRALLGVLAIPVIGAEGFEADDVLATLATEARDRKHPVIIVTGDRDAYQLVEDPYVRVLYNRRGVSDYALYDEAGIEDRTGVLPHKYPLLASLRGDPSDNLPGVPGVGEKTAAKLINEYGDLDTLYAHLDALSPKLRENLAASLERVRMNAEVIPLIRDVPLGTSIDQLQLGGWDTEEARALFAEFELKTVWPRLLTVMHDGLLGPARPGGEPSVDAWGLRRRPGCRPGRRPARLVGRPRRSWAPPTLRRRWPGSNDGGRRPVREGNLAVFARWTGDPGRSPLAGLAVTPEAGRRRGPTAVLASGRGRALDDPNDGGGAGRCRSAPAGSGWSAHDVKRVDAVAAARWEWTSPAS